MGKGRKKIQGNLDGAYGGHMRDGGVREGGRVSEVCEVGGKVWPVLAPPPPLLFSQPSPLSSQPVSGSLPPPPADFSLGGSEKNCPLWLSPTATARALPCPPDINQHTLLQARALTLPSELLWRTGWWAAVSSPGPHLQMRHPTSQRGRRGTGY